MSAVLDRVVELAQAFELTEDLAVARTTEYMRFMALKAKHDLPGVPSMLAPSALVDTVWHCHLLDTE